MAAFRCLFTAFPRREKTALGSFVSWGHGHGRLIPHSILKSLESLPSKRVITSFLQTSKGLPWKSLRAQSLAAHQAHPGLSLSPQLLQGRLPLDPIVWTWHGEVRVQVGCTDPVPPLPPRSAAPSDWILRMCCSLETHDHAATSVLCSVGVNNIFSVLVSLFLPKTPSSRTAARNPRK